MCSTIDQRSGSDHGLDFGFLHRKQIITDGYRAGIQVVPGRQHNGQNLVWNHMHYKSCVAVAGKLHVRSTREPNGNDGTWTMTGTNCAESKDCYRSCVLAIKQNSSIGQRLRILVTKIGVFFLGETQFRCLWMKCRLRRLHHNSKH